MPKSHKLLPIIYNDHPKQEAKEKLEKKIGNFIRRLC